MLLIGCINLNSLAPVELFTVDYCALNYVKLFEKKIKLLKNKNKAKFNMLFPTKSR